MGGQVEGGKSGASTTRGRGASGGQVGGQVEGQVGGQVAPSRPLTAGAILAFCRSPRGLKEIMAQVGVRKRDHAAARIKALIRAGWLALTVSGKPRSSRQKYVTTASGGDTRTAGARPE